MHKKLRTVFMGTPEFAAKSLEETADKTDCLLVVTQPDRAKGRGKKLLKSPVKEAAESLGIPVITPEKIRDDKESINLIRELKPDFIAVVAFGQILPREILDIPKYGCINLHASLLPHLRGASPIQSAVLRGDEKSGNTTMLMNEGLDTGDMLLKEETDITGMTYGEVHDVLMESGKVLLTRTMELMADGKITPVKQNEELVTHAPKITREDEWIDFYKQGKEIVSLILSMNPKPFASFKYKDTVIKTGNAEFTKENSGKEPGTVISASKDGINVAVRDGVLIIKTVQMPGKKLIPVKDFLNGNNIEEGAVLNEN